jgi:ATP adenylyltransferase
MVWLDQHLPANRGSHPSMPDQPLQRLWAPWRLSYVARPEPGGENQACFICQGLESTADRQSLLVLRTPLSVVYLNRYPYNNGHLLVAPRTHVGRLEQLSPEQISDSMRTLQRMIGELDRSLQPDGYNIGLNLEKAAGAGLPHHLHWHVVPRWHGDTNFMPVISETKVIAQSLESLYDLLVKQIANGPKPA